MVSPSAIPPAPIIDGVKTFIPLENNPDTLALLSINLGLKNISFHDLFSIDPIIQDIPRPVHALIFIAPSPVYYKVREDEKHLFGPDSNGVPPFPLTGSDSPVVWFKQTIEHACGLIGLLHAVANNDGQKTVTAGSSMAELLSEANPLEPEPRAQLLYDSAFLEQAHMSAAVAGDTSPPDPSEPNGMHFICFVKGKDGKLWDLEGGWSGPVPRVELSEDEDVLCEKAVADGPGRYLRVGSEMGISEFSCVAVVLEQAEE